MEWPPDGNVGDGVGGLSSSGLVGSGLLGKGHLRALFLKGRSGRKVKLQGSWRPCLKERAAPCEEP